MFCVVFRSDSWGHKVGQASWSPSSGVIVQTGLGQSQRGTGLARPGALHIRFLSSAPRPEREGLEGMGSPHSDWSNYLDVTVAFLDGS